MARRPFDPSSHGLEKLEYRRGDILDRSSTDALVADADVVVHLAFLIFGSKSRTRQINLDGSRNVFESALQANVRRLVYTSSVAAYGFHQDNPQPLTEDVEVRGHETHYYSHQKAEVERLLVNLTTTMGQSTDVYVTRPCTVGGPTALMPIQRMPFARLGHDLPAPARAALRPFRSLRPVLPDPGVVFQLVHEDDVASALVSAVLGKGRPGAYNLAAEGELHVADLARALGWYSVPVPKGVVGAAAALARLPLMPAQSAWLNALRVPVVMDCTKAQTELGWRPKFDAFETLEQTVASARAQGLLA